jgi:hypothetical protein
VVLSWEINADWQYDASMTSEVEVTFRAEGKGTRVELEHRNFEGFGSKGPEVRASIDSPGGWTGIMAEFAKRVASAS